MGLLGSLLALTAAALGQQPAAPTAAAVQSQRQSVQQMRAAMARQFESVARMKAAFEAQQAAIPRPTAALRLIWPNTAPAPAWDGEKTATIPQPGRLPQSPACAPLPTDEIAGLLRAAGAREGLGVDLLGAVIEQESGFRPCAVSSKGALGLMQLMPATVEMLGVSDPFSPKENVDAGAKFLKSLLVRYEGDLKRALGAYNAGPTKVDQAGGVPEIPETLNYVEQILSRLGK